MVHGYIHTSNTERNVPTRFSMDEIIRQVQNNDDYWLNSDDDDTEAITFSKWI